MTFYTHRLRKNIVATSVDPVEEICYLGSTKSIRIRIEYSSRLQSIFTIKYGQVYFWVDCVQSILSIHTPFSLVNIIENKDPNTSYAKAVRRGSLDPVMQQSTNGNSQSMSIWGLIDEGYGDQIGNGDSSTSSETQLKRPFVPLATETKQRPNGITDPRPIPVHMTNRNAPFQRRSTSLNNENDPRSKTATSSRAFSTHQERTLLIGDSIIKGINPRGLKKEIKLCPRWSHYTGHMR